MGAQACHVVSPLVAFNAMMAPDPADSEGGGVSLKEIVDGEDDVCRTKGVEVGGVHFVEDFDCGLVIR